MSDGDIITIRCLKNRVGSGGVNIDIPLIRPMIRLVSSGIEPSYKYYYHRVRKYPEGQEYPEMRVLRK